MGSRPNLSWYYEGYVDNLSEILNKHAAATDTTYGVRRSHIAGHMSKDKENKVCSLLLNLSL